MRPEPTGTRVVALDPGHAVVALEDADDREQIFDVLLRAVRSQMSFAALLSVHGDELRGRRALVEPAVERSRIDAWRIPRGAVAAFEAAIQSRAPAIATLASDEPFLEGLLEQLGGRAPSVLVLPLAIGARTVALVVAHRGDEAFALADVADLVPLAAAASPALARVLAARAKATATARPARTTADYEVEVVVPGATKLRTQLAELRTGEAWEEVADAIRALVAEGMEHGDPDEDEQLELLVELGHVEAQRLGRIDRAIEAWRSAQTIDAGEPRVLDALQALFAQEARWPDAADLLEKRVALADDPAARIALLLELAAIAHERLDDDERAIAAYERILHWEPGHEVATRELEHLYSGREQWEPLAALLLDRASREPDPAAATTALEAVAQMYEDKLGDLRSAFLVWLAVFRRAPERESLFEQLQRLGAGAQVWDEVLAEGHALAEELEAAHPAVAARVWQLVAAWTREHATNRDDVVHALERAHRADPANAEVLDELTARLAEDTRWIDLAAVLSARARDEADPARRGELHARLGDLYENQLGEPAEAIACYEEAHRDAPGARVVLAALHRLYRRTGAWAALAELLPQLIEAHDPASELARRVELHVELGDVLANHLGRADDAVGAYRAALELDPRHPAAFQGLARVYQATGQAEELLDASEAEVETADRARQLQRYPELAEAWAERGRFDRAAACWRKLVALDPGSQGAHRGLARALRGGAQWDALAAELRAQLDVVTARDDRRALLLELGDVLAAQLDDATGARGAYEAALGLDASHARALDGLARLHERAGDAAAAVSVLERLLDQTTAKPRARAEVFCRIGEVHLDARDVAAARLQFVQAIALDADSAAAHEGLARVHLQQDELVAAGEELVRAAELHGPLPDKLRCLVDAAWVFRHRLHDSERARQCLQLVLELEPEHADAKLALAELLQDSRQWETLWPHLEQEVARVKEDPAVTAGERAEIYARAARCALELDRFATALELFELACANDAAPALQIERAEALYRSKALDAAAHALQTIVLRHGKALERDALVAVYRRLAEIHTALGKLSQAQLFHQKVLEADPGHRATLKDLADLHSARGRFDEAIANLRTLAERVEPGERAPILERIGDLYRDKLGNAPRAASIYLEALELDGGNRRVLQRLLDLQSADGQWKAAVDTIARFLDHEADPVRRAAYHLAAAEIRRNELRDKAGALEAYEQALDELFREQPLSAETRMRGLDTFRIVDELVTADRSWKYQEQSYRRMIKRVPKDDPALVHLWHALGEIYRTRLKLYQSALEAFELAHSLDPDKSAERAGIIAELYALLGKQQPHQVTERAAKLVELDPRNPEVYRTLGRASLEAGRLDEAWCVARALVFLKQATAEEAALYKRLRAHEARKATGLFDEESWALVRHADEDRTISAIFALVWEGPVALRAGPPKAFDLKPKDRLPVEDGTGVIAKIFRHAARVLGVALPDVYVQPQRSGRLLLGNIIDRGRLAPAVIVGRDLMTGYRDTELAAAIGALLALLRPAYYLKLALPGLDELEAALAAAAALVGRAGVGRPELEPLRTGFAAEMKQRLARGTAEALAALVARLPAQPDVARWRNAVDMTAQRAGLLVSGELAAAARMLSTEASGPGRPRAHQRVHELVAYSVSPAYFAARQHLGVAVE